MKIQLLPLKVIGGFTGVMLGVFAQCTSPDNMYADFDWFEYKTNE
ncbi:MAG: hypothetical protein IKP43_04485 [Bacteroidaceae bacterium]|nr:hypothetical protein [Bacteroidaceae bacterium]